MDQNQNGVLGQAGVDPTGDQMEQRFFINGLQVIAVTPDSVFTPPGLSSITVTFNEGVRATSLTGQVTLNGPAGQIQPLTVTDATVGNTNLANVWRITFT